MAALAATAGFGLQAEELAAALESFSPTGMRLDIRRCGDILLINDAYNAAPASMEGALEVLAQAQGRKVAVLGDMLELGCEERRGHQRVGVAAAHLGIDVVIAVGPRSKDIAEAAKQEGLRDVHQTMDVKSAREVLSSVLRGGDNLLLKASRGMALEQLTEVLEGKVES